jgi:hypothetical protein
VRTSRSFTPKGASSSIMLPSQKAPPWGAIASPQIVITSDLWRGGSVARLSAIHWVLVMSFTIGLDMIQNYCVLPIFCIVL